MIRKTIAVATLSAALVLAGTGVASAHECFIPNRSDQGNAGATNSNVWFTGTLAEFFGFAHTIFGGDPLTSEQIAEAVAMAEAQGIPTSFTIFGNGLLSGGKGVPAGNVTNGKGVDHVFESYGAALAGIFATVAG